jgi:hypothetical protein
MGDGRLGREADGPVARCQSLRDLSYLSVPAAGGAAGSTGSAPEFATGRRCWATGSGCAHVPVTGWGPPWIKPSQCERGRRGTTETGPSKGCGPPSGRSSDRSAGWASAASSGTSPTSGRHLTGPCRSRGAVCASGCPLPPRSPHAPRPPSRPPISDRPQPPAAGKHGKPAPAPGEVTERVPVRQAGAPRQRCDNSGQVNVKKEINVLLQAPDG